MLPRPSDHQLGPARAASPQGLRPVPPEPTSAPGQNLSARPADLGAYMRRHPRDPDVSAARVEVDTLIDRLERRVIPALRSGDIASAVTHAELVSGQADDLVDRLRRMARLDRARPLEGEQLSGTPGCVPLTRASDGTVELVHVSRIGQYMEPPLEQLRQPGWAQARTAVQRRDARGLPAGWMPVREDMGEVCRLVAEAEAAAGVTGPEAA